MKTNITTLYSTAVVALLLLTTACQGKKFQLQPQETSITTPIVKTEKQIDYTGGTVTIQLKEAGATVSVSDPWLHPKVEGNKVTLTADRNDSFESRTAIVGIKLGNETYTLPVTQLGIIYILKTYDYQFPTNGGKVSFYYKSDHPITIEGANDSWLSYEITEEAISFTAKAQPSKSEDRSCTVVIKGASYSPQSVTLSQPGVKIAYEDFIGNYKLEYTDKKGNPIKTINAKISSKEKGKSYTIEGLGLPIEATFTAEGQLLITCQILKDADTSLVALCALELDGDGLGFNPKYGVISSIQEGSNGMAFKMVPYGTPDPEMVNDKQDPIIFSGFITLTYDKGKQSFTGEYKEKGQVSRFGLMKFTKQP